MIPAAIIAAYLAGYAFTLRLAIMSVYWHERSRYPILYNDSDYRYRDAPHGDDWFTAAGIAIPWPVTLPWLAFQHIHRRVAGSPEQRWAVRRAELAAVARERDALAALVDELNHATGITPDMPA